MEFHRIARARGAGCLAYALLVPVFAGVAALIGGMAGVGIAYVLKLSDWASGVLSLLAAAFGLVAGAVWGVRDYRRRSGDRFVVHADRIVGFRAGVAVDYRFEDLRWFEGPSPTHLKFRWNDGRRLELIAEEWPVREIGDAVITRAVPGMVQRWNRQLAEGETLVFRPARLLAIRFLVTGVLALGLGGWFLFRVLSHGIQERYRRFVTPVLLFGAGLTSLVQMLRARGGMFISQEGVRRRSADPVIPWQGIRSLVVRPSGASLEFLDGSKPITLGALSRNYPACLALLGDHVPELAVDRGPQGSESSTP